MKRKRFVTFFGRTVAGLLIAIALPLLTSFLLTSCTSPSTTDTNTNSNPSGNTTLLVSSAASLKEAMEEIKVSYQQSQPKVTINYNFGASGALLQQIQQGATTDMFISAGKKQVDTLEKSGQIIAETRSILAKNRLVLITAGDRNDIVNFSDLQKSEIKKIAIGEPRSVPAGEYAEQTLKKLGIYDKLKPKFVYGNNVRQVLAAVESGNADAGFVYQTDAKVAQKVKVAIAVDEKNHSPIVYPMAVLKNSKNPEMTKAFIKYLNSDRAQTILTKHGFIVTK